MKKNRPGTILKVLMQKEDFDKISTRILSETTSTGVRFYEANRRILNREIVSVNSSFGEIMVKKISEPHGGFSFSPEFEVCKKIAVEHNLPLKQVMDRIKKEIN
jgi:hypothetical protein